ncbi:MAG: sigma-70 family RNA polymerase sigma factor [Eubacteriales bacterium]|nr:sigma-70 family RNA polymerase sigma factor [Eubacteriales bacterium]
MIQLVKRAMKSDTDAFLELMERNSLAMYKVARGILNNDEDAADAIQDTILTCFEKIHTLNRPEYFKTWMIRILINECNGILRHYRSLNLQEDFPEVSRMDASLAEFEFKEMLAQVEEKYRIILILHYVEGFKIAEIAELLDMNENTVKTRLARAREQLRTAYTDTPGGQPGKQHHGSRQDRGGVSDEKENRLQYSSKITAG